MSRSFLRDLLILLAIDGSAVCLVLDFQINFVQMNKVEGVEIVLERQYLEETRVKESVEERVDDVL